MVPVSSVTHFSPASFLSPPSNFVTFSVLVFHFFFPHTSLRLSVCRATWFPSSSPYMSACFCLRPSFHCSLKRPHCCSCRIICIILPEGAYKTLWLFFGKEHRTLKVLERAENGLSVFFFPPQPNHKMRTNGIQVIILSASLCFCSTGTLSLSFGSL